MLKLTPGEKAHLEKRRSELMSSPAYRRKDPQAIEQLQAIQSLMFPGDDKPEKNETPKKDSDPNKSALRSKLNRLRSSEEYLTGDPKTVQAVTELYEKLNPPPPSKRNFVREEIMQSLGMKTWHPGIVERHLKRYQSSDAYLNPSHPMHKEAVSDVTVFYQALYGDDAELTVPQVTDRQDTTLMHKTYDQPGSDAGEGAEE